ncbi:MAG: hypothetical protein PHQ42_02650 [Patescibacteria group bacterium]|nr:hypothetical protein [Patescibacteria group bacterium]
MNATNATAVSSYETIETVGNVWVKVPRQGREMRLVSAHTFESAGGPISVPDHWQNGTIVQQDPLIIVNRHFFVEQEDLGEKICAKVDVVRKTGSDGRVFIILDVRPCEPNLDAPFLVMKFKKGADRGTPIPETDFFLQFNRTAPLE